MGVSTNAYLFYGFTFHDVEAGIGEPPQWKRREGDSIDPRWTDWEYHCDAATVSRLKDLGIAIHCHRHSEYPAYSICLSGTWMSAYRGHPVVIENLDVPEDADTGLRLACELLGIKFEQPKWVLASHWG